MKYYYIYKTINKINDHYYIGKHISTCLHDNYLGSGKRLNNELNKYGKTNFTKIILFVFNNLADLDKKEAEIVTNELLKDENCLNLIQGGWGSWNYINANKLQTYKHWRDQNKVEEHRRNSSERMRQYNLKRGASPTFIGRKHTAKTRIKMSESHIGINTWSKGGHHTEATRDKIRNGVLKYLTMRTHNNGEMPEYG